MNRHFKDRAPVGGGSMAGLPAPQARSSIPPDAVTVIDRDGLHDLEDLPEGSTHRRGVPGGRHSLPWRRADSKPWSSCRALDRVDAIPLTRLRLSAVGDITPGITLRLWPPAIHDR